MTRTTMPTSPERARLATALRELKERTGLSLTGLAEQTTYSRSSWDRYLSGKALPPHQAVRDLCRLAHEPEGRCLALWEIAEAEWRGRAGGAVRTGTDSGPGPDTRPVPSPPREDEAGTGAGAGAGHGGGRRRPVIAMLLAGVCAVALGSVTAVIYLLPHGNSGSDKPPSPSPSAPEPGCHGAACEGKDPLLMYCGPSPATLATRHLSNGVGLELRYSMECGTSWARMWDTHVGDRLEVSAGGRRQGVRITDSIDAESYVYTPMTTARPGTEVRACFHPATGGRSDCFSGRVG